MKRFANIILFLLLPVLIFLTFNMHSKFKSNTYHSVIWADAAGYYSYLPLWFIYGNNSNWPENIEKNTGYGFSVDKNAGVIKNKYPCGIAILQTPFFLGAHIIAEIKDEPTDGFSKIYINSIILSSAFYTWAGIVLLYLILLTRFTILQSLLSSLLVLIATNLYYYAITSNGMSHSYSFFLFCILLYLTVKKSIGNFYFKYFLIGLVSVLIILSRTTDIIFLPVLFLFGTNSLNELKNKIKQFFNNKRSLLLYLAGFIPPLIIQTMFIKKSYGSFFYDTYNGETFSNWCHPFLLSVWFSFNNGLFVYTPFVLLVLIGIYHSIQKMKYENLFIGFLFIAVSLICASWWNWWFGCSYGARNFTEYYALFIFPASGFIYSRRKSYQKILVWSFILICILINFNILYYYDGCFYGGDWDFNSYLKLYH